MATQLSGHIINYSGISQDIGVDDKTVKNGFIISFFLIKFSARHDGLFKHFCFAPGLAGKPI